MTGPLASAQRVVRIAVVGDPDTGKTSLISTAANDTFDARPVPVLPPTKLSPDYTPERIPLLLTDTSSQPEGSKVTDYVIQTSDAVVVCFDPRRPITLENVRQVWYPKIQKLNPDVPVILACCKSDKLLERDAVGIKERVERVAADLHNLECCLNCSSRHNRMVMDVFYYALKAVLYPLQPLYDRVDKTMKQAGVRAFQRVFKMCDLDKDGYLSDAELNYFQKACFNIELNPEELRGIKQVVRARCPAGLHESMPGQPGGLTLEGFLFLHALFIERGRMETVWQVLRRFGYNDELRLSSDLLDSVNYTYPNDLVLELSDAALSFLVSQFHLHDAAGDGLLAWEALQALFATAPAFPTEWQSERINRLLVAGTHGAVHNLDSFLARWRYCAMADPRGTVANLLYLGYDGLPQSLLERRTRRRVDRRRHGADMAARTTISCLVFGPRGAGKTSLVAALAGRSSDDITPGPMPGSPAPPLTAAAPVRSDLLPVWPARGLSSTVGSPGFGGSGAAGLGAGGGDTERQGAAGAGAQGGDAGSSMSGAAGGGGGGGGGGGPGVSVSGGAGYSYGGGAPLERVLIMTEVPGMVMQEMVSEAALGGLPRSSGGTVGGGAAASGAGALPPLLMPSATTISSAAQGGAPSSSSTSSSAASARNAQQTLRAGSGVASGSSSSTAAGDGSSAAPGTSTSGAMAAAATPTGLPWPSSAAMAGQLPDLSRCDVAVFVFDVSDAASWRRACDAAVVLASLPGCDTLPCVFVAAKEELGMAEELKREVQERCVELCIPEPVPASVQTGNLAHLYRYIVAAAINPSPHIPDTPARKARRRLHRQLLFGGLAAAGLLAGAYLVYSMVSSSSSSASTATSSSSTSGTSSSASATGVSSSRSHASPSYAAGSSGSSSTRAVVPASSLPSPSLTSSLAGSLEAKAKSWFS